MVARCGSVWCDVTQRKCAVGASEMIKYDSATPMVPGFYFRSDTRHFHVWLPFGRSYATQTNPQPKHRRCIH